MPDDTTTQTTPGPQRRRSDTQPVPERPLAAAVLMLGARQLADIWLSLFMLLQGSVLSIILVLATLRGTWAVPIAVYTVTAITGLTLCILGLVGGIVLWRRAEHQVQTHGE